MNETRGPGPVQPRRDTVCIDSMRILDSCRDKDCFEDVRVYLTDFGQEVIEKSGSVRVKSTEVVWLQHPCGSRAVQPRLLPDHRALFHQALPGGVHLPREIPGDRRDLRLREEGRAVRLGRKRARFQERSRQQRLLRLPRKF